MKSRCVAAASSGVAQWNGRRIPSPCASSSRNAAHIWRIASEKPNSKIAPVRCGYAETGAEIDRLPRLRPARLVLHPAQRLRVLGRVRDRAVGAVDLDRPRVRLAGRDALRLDAERERVPLVLGLAQQHGVVPRVARRPCRRRRPGRSGTTSDRIARTFAGAQPARSGRWSACMPRSPMTAVLAVESRPALPVDRLRPGRGRWSGGTARAPRSAPEPALRDEARDLLAAGIERQLGRAPDEQVGMAARSRR